MNLCQDLAGKLGFYCSQVITKTDERCTYISTPFVLTHGKPLDIYVIERSDGIVITDDGFSIAEMMAAGINLSDRRSWKGISDIAIRYGFTLEDSGAIVVKVQAKDVEKWLQAGLGLLAELAAWETERIQSKDADMSFHDAVEEVLRRHKLQKPVSTDASAVFGGREYLFDFKWGDTFVDVVRSSRQAVNAKLRKAVEIKLSETERSDTLFIVDDRADQQKGREDCAVLGLHSKAVQFTVFEKMAGQQFH